MKNELIKNEINLLRNLADNAYADGSPFQNWAWSFNVLEGKNNKTFLSLVSKGFATSNEIGFDEYYKLTEKAREFTKGCYWNLPLR